MEENVDRVKGEKPIGQFILRLLWRFQLTEKLKIHKQSFTEKRYYEKPRTPGACVVIYFLETQMQLPLYYKTFFVVTVNKRVVIIRYVLKHFWRSYDEIVINYNNIVVITTKRLWQKKWPNVMLNV